MMEKEKMRDTAYNDDRDALTGVERVKRKEDSDCCDISFLSVVRVLAEKWWILLIVAALCAAGVFACSLMKNTVDITAGAKMYVNNGELPFLTESTDAALSNVSISSAAELIPTYIEIIKTRRMMTAVADRLFEEYGYDYRSDIDLLIDSVSGDRVQGTVFFTVTVKLVCNDTPDEIRETGKKAVDIVNTIAGTMSCHIEEVFARSSATVVDNAVGYDVVNESSMRKTLLGFAAGLLTGAFVIVMKDCVLSDGIHSPEYLTKQFDNIPILAQVPAVSKNGRKSPVFEKRTYSRIYSADDRKNNERSGK